VLLLVGLIARIIATTHEGWEKPPEYRSDAAEYDSYAWNLAQGHGYIGISPDVYNPDGSYLVHPSAYRIPGISLYWAALYKIFGHKYSAVRISECLMDTLTILLIFTIARKCFSNTVAILAAAIYAVWPPALQYVCQLRCETQYTFLLFVFILLCLIFAERKTWSWSIAAGLVLGLALLTRGNGIMMVALVFPWSVWQFRKNPRVMVRGIAIALVALATLVPWTIRNYRLFHAYIPFESGGGDVLLGVYNNAVASDPNLYGSWTDPTALPEYTKLLTQPNDELVRDRIQKQLAIQWIRNHPDKWWYLQETRFRRGWTPFLQPWAPLLRRLEILAVWGTVVLLLAIGFFPTAIHFLRTGSPAWIIHLGILHYEITVQVFYGASRLRYPVEGLCIILASATAVWIGKGIGKRMGHNSTSNSQSRTGRIQTASISAV
jgi:4-amino-4-deoxy-L-arabinose transferase-like glycosyltransferase